MMQSTDVVAVQIVFFLKQAVDVKRKRAAGTGLKRRSLCVG
jgi:hypothetical protein